MGAIARLRWGDATEEREGQEVTVARLNHAVLFVSDVTRAADFYAAALGFEVVSEEPQINAVFMRAAGGDNHQVELLNDATYSFCSPYN